MLPSYVKIHHHNSLDFLLQVKNIGFTGVFRLIFRPLVDEFPCFGAVCYSLRKKVQCMIN